MLTSISRPAVTRSADLAPTLLVSALGNRQVSAQEVATLDRETQNMLRPPKQITAKLTGSQTQQALSVPKRHAAEQILAKKGH